MSSLADCIVRGGKAFDSSERSELLSMAQKIQADSQTPIDPAEAGRLAVEQVLNDVQSERDGIFKQLAEREGTRPAFQLSESNRAVPEPDENAPKQGDMFGGKPTFSRLTSKLEWAARNLDVQGWTPSKKNPAGAALSREILQTIEKKGLTDKREREELEWSGLRDYLSLDPNARFTRQDIVDYLEGNRVVVSENVADQIDPNNPRDPLDDRGSENTTVDIGYEQDSEYDDLDQMTEGRFQPLWDSWTSWHELSQDERDAAWQIVISTEFKADTFNPREEWEGVDPGTLPVLGDIYRAAKQQYLRTRNIKSLEEATDEQRTAVELYARNKTSEAALQFTGFDTNYEFVLEEILRDYGYSDETEVTDEADLEGFREDALNRAYEPSMEEFTLELEGQTDVRYDVTIVPAGREDGDGDPIIWSIESEDFRDYYAVMGEHGETLGIYDDLSDAERAVQELAEEQYPSFKWTPQDVRWGASGWNAPGEYHNDKEFKITLPNHPMKFEEKAHFPVDDNTLVFLRTNERDLELELFGDDTVNSLFVEEMQSDWHQLGRQVGYLPLSEYTDDWRTPEERTKRATTDVKGSLWEQQRDTGNAFDAAYKTIRDWAQSNLTLIDWPNQLKQNANESLDKLREYVVSADNERRQRQLGRSGSTYSLDGPPWINKLKELGAPADAVDQLMPLAKTYEHTHQRLTTMNRRGIPPEAPFGVNDSWARLGTKRALIEAISNPKIEALAWSHSSTLAGRWGIEHLEMYVNHYDRRIPAIIKELTGVEPTLVKNQVSNTSPSYWILPITDDLRNQINSKPMWLFRAKPEGEANAAQSLTPEQRAEVRTEGEQRLQSDAITQAALESGKLSLVNQQELELLVAQDSMWSEISGNGTILGAYNNETGEAVLLTDNMDSASDFVPVAWHELLHEAQDYAKASGDERFALLVGDQRDALVARLQQLEKYGSDREKEILARMRETFTGTDASKSTDQNVYSDEYLAYVAQTLRAEKDMPRSAKQWLQDVVAAVQTGIRRVLGVDGGPSNMTLDEFGKFVEVALGIRSTQPNMGGGTARGAPALMQRSERSGQMDMFEYLRSDNGPDTPAWQQAAAKGLPMTRKARMQRASQQGFDTKTQWYHHTNEPNVPAFSMEYVDIGVHLGTQEQAFRRGRAKASGASRPYPGAPFATGANVMPLHVRSANTLRMPDVGDWDNPVQLADAMMGVPELARWKDDIQQIREEAVNSDTGSYMDSYDDADGDAGFRPFWQDSALAELRDIIQSAGYDSVRYRNEVESSSEDNVDSLIVLDPANIRSVNAAFDPNDTASPVLMASQRTPKHQERVEQGNQWTQRIQQAAKPSPTQQLSQTPGSMAAPTIENDLSLMEHTVAVAPQLLWLTGRRHLAEIAPPNMTAVRDYVRDAEQMDADRTEMLSRDGELLMRWHEWGRNNKTAANNLSEVMHLTTIAGYDPTMPYKPIITETEYLKERSRLTAAQQKAPTQDEKNRIQRRLNELDTSRQEELTRKRAKPMIDLKYKALTREAKSLYAEVRDRYDKQSRQMYAELKQRMERIEMSDNVRQELQQRLRLMFESQRVRGPYFPLSRFGDYWAVARDRSTDDIVSYRHFDSKRAADVWIKEMKEAGHVTRQGAKSENRDWGEVDPNFASTVAGLVANTDGIERAKRMELADNIWQLYLQTLPEMSRRKQFIHRKKTPGFNDDAMRAFAHLSLHNAHHVVKIRHGDKLAAHVNRAASQAKELSDSTYADRLVAELREANDWAMNPTSNSLAQSLTALGFVGYLGVSPAAAAVNMVQTPMVALPMLAAKPGNGYAKASAELLRAAREFGGGVIKNTGTRAKLRKAFLLQHEKAHYGDVLKGDEKAAYDELIRRGLFDKTLSHDLAGVAEEGLDRNLKVRMVMDWLSASFHNAEVFNREVTGIAAYRLARRRGMGHTAAVNEADQLVRDAHFDYSNAARARALRPSAMKVIGQFKQYSLNMSFRILRDAYVATAAKGIDPDIRKEALSRAAGMFTMSLFFAGISGTAITSAVMALATLFHDLSGDDEPWDAEADTRSALKRMVGETMADIIWNGPVDFTTKASIGGRVGLDLWRMWVQDDSQGYEGREKLAHILVQMAGPVVGGTGGMLFDAYQLGTEGEWHRALEQMTPKFVRDPLKAARFAMEGVTNKRGDPILPKGELSEYELFMQAIGFVPAELQKQYGLNRARKQRDRDTTERKRTLMNRSWKLVSAGKGLNDKLLKDITRYNQSNPEDPITADGLIQSMESRFNASARSLDGIDIPNAAKRARILREIDF